MRSGRGTSSTKLPRRGNLWVTAVITEPFRGETAVAFCKWNRTISLIFAAVIEQWATVFDHVEKCLIDGSSSQRGVIVEIADELATQCPHIVHVLLDRLGQQTQGGQMFQERAEQDHELLAGRQIFLQAHPRAWPAVQIAAIVFQSMARDRGGAVYLGSFRRRLPPHAAAHHDSKPMSSLSGIRLPAGPLQFRSQEH